MPLEPSSVRFTGKSLQVEPVYGWGWCRMNSDEPSMTYEEAKGPIPFTMRIEGFFEAYGCLRGAKGQVDQSGHPFAGWWAVFSTRGGGPFDFEHNPPYCNIMIGQDLVEASWPKVGGPGTVAGFALIQKYSSPNDPRDPKP